MTEIPESPETLVPPPTSPETLFPERVSEPYFIEKKLSYYNSTVMVGKDGRLKDEGKLLTKVMFRDLFELREGDFGKIKYDIDVSFRRVMSKEGINGKQRRAYEKIFQSLRGKLDLEMGMSAAYFLARQNPEREERRKTLQTTGSDIAVAKENLKKYFKSFCQEDVKTFEDPDEERIFLEFSNQMERSLRKTIISENEAETRRIETAITNLNHKPPRKNLFSNSLLKKVCLTAGIGVVIGTIVGVGFAGSVRGYTAASPERLIEPVAQYQEASSDLLLPAQSIQQEAPKIQKESAPPVEAKIASGRILEKDAIVYAKTAEQKLSGDVPAKAVLSMLDIESSMGSNIGKGKAMGPAQIMPETLEDIRTKFTKTVGRDPNPTNPEDAAILSALILKRLGWKNGNSTSIKLAVMRYGGFGSKTETTEANKYWQKFQTRSQVWENRLNQKE